MRLKLAASFLLACICGLGVAGCRREQAQAPQQQPQAEASAPAQATDLSVEANQKYLADNAKKAGVIVRPSGLQYRVIKAGSGKSPTPNDMVTVTYKGAFISGKVFDQTMPGQTATFPAGQLIPGWVEALQLMKEGDEWELVIPSALAYGPEGAGGGAIPPDQTLVFDMTLLKVE